jgi:2-keto-4-pentenoate hydratase/2-oxohepta-3-ene-1,7-dioic acid hydratase in catechol pathway
MRIYIYRPEQAVEARLAVSVDDGEIVDVAPASEWQSLVAAGADHRRVVAGRARQSGGATVDLSRVQLLPPVPPKPTIYCVGLNYRDHATESGLDLPIEPAVFLKLASALSGANEPIVIPRESVEVDGEVDLAAVIGKPARNVSAQDALDHVAGYTILNDVSARDWQMRSSQWSLSKSFDSFAPLGPALVTTDEIADPQDLRLGQTLSGEVLQESHTGQMIFSVAEVVAHLSRVCALQPGDVISTGTPVGVGFARNPPRFLRAGDHVEAWIEGLGVLRNRVIDEDAPRNLRSSSTAEAP